MRASRNPVISMSMLRIMHARVIRKVGQFARWSITVSPRVPSPKIRIRFSMLIASLSRIGAITIMYYDNEGVILDLGLTHVLAECKVIIVRLRLAASSNTPAFRLEQFFRRQLCREVGSGEQYSIIPTSQDISI